MIRKIRKSRFAKVVACTLALSFLVDFLNPMQALAVGSGPNQSEFTSFSNASISELVNTANGNFSYNIPLMDIEGYPINISYSAGATMDQEASWVGLGWTLNPGGLNRTMRGVPDDFKGEEIEQEVNIKTNYTFGAEIGGGAEIFGAGDGGVGVSLGVGIGVFYNNYKGLGLNQSLNFGISAGNFFSAGVGIDANSQQGMTISPNVSLSAKKKGENGNSASASVGVGTSYNSRSGLGDLSLSVSASVKNQQENTTKDKDGNETTHKSSNSFSQSNSATIPIGTNSSFPSIQFPRKASATELRVKFGGEIQGGYAHGYMKGYLMTEEISERHMSSPAYGYMYAEEGEGKLDALHDFNRVNDGMVSKETPNLPLTNHTYDIFTASAQGLNSMFRAHRSDVGTVYDNLLKTTNSSDKIGVEVGLGSYVEVGANTNSYDLEQSIGKWTAFDNAKLEFIGKDNNLVNTNYDYNGTYFSQSGEGLAINEDYYNDMGGDAAVRLKLNSNDPSSITSELVDRTGGVLNGNVSNLRNDTRTKRGVVINYLNAKQASDYGLERKIESHTLNDFNYNVATSSSADYIKGEGHYSNIDNSVSDRVSHANGMEHHISEVSVMDPAGKRYIYGIPSYTRAYEERSFNIAKSSDFNTGSMFDEGIIDFNPIDNSIDNSRKKDGFFLKKSVPDYATSYLLTASLSTDYVDVSGNGPSIDDLGSYTKFNYTRVHANYGWKQPFEKDKANFNAGFRSEKKDDRANYTKGKKEIWYVHSIETKNYIAEFKLKSRVDAVEANFNIDGGPGTAQMYALEEIRLYARKDKETNGINAVPIKTVHFVYSNSLCSNLPAGAGPGKLTLDEIYFSHGKSTKAWFSPYKFFYEDANHDKVINGLDADYNEDYAHNSFDRWGGFKKQKTTTDQNLNGNPLSNADFPYVNNSPNSADYQPDVDAAMWAMHTIQLPSGGTIEIDYEADDYAYVQNKKAMQMMKVAGMYTGSSTLSNKLYGDASNMFGGGRDPNLEMAIELPYPIKAANVNDAKDAFIERYMKEENRGALKSSIIKKLYYKCVVNTGLESDEYDFVTGYADVESITGMMACISCGSSTESIDAGGSNYYDRAIIKLNPAKLKDDNRGSDVNPISKATWQMVRTYLYKLAFPAASMEDDNLGLNKETIQLLFSFIEDIRVMINGVNKEMRRKGIGQNIVPSNSFVRLHNPNYKKIGGGHRVKQVVMDDEWKTMNANSSNTAYEEKDARYGKVYSYTTTHPTLKDINGNPLEISSGVTSYEPQIGGDENPFRKPIEYELKRELYANDILYAEVPFGEAFFPSPSVIYSHVRVRDYTPPSVSRTVNGTGESVFEYYTAYDFPIKVDYTTTQKIEEKPNPIASFFSSKSTYELAMSQGYSIVLNDMHGKAKGTTIYGEGKSDNDFISRVEYFYKTTGDYHKELDNTVKVLNEQGLEENVLVNVDFDMVHDSKQTNTKSTSRTFQFNVNTIVLPAFGIPLPIPTAFPQFSEDTKRHKMSVITKVVQKYGILEKTIAEDQQALIETKNELFDKETGQVLLTRVTNQYDKNIDHRSMTYPAHWAYDRMGPAYKNIDKEFIETTGGDVVHPSGQINSPYSAHFVVGDEVMVYSTTGVVDQRYWVIYGECKDGQCGELVNLQGLFLIDRDGQLYNNNSLTANSFKIIRSGRRNQASTPIANFTAKQGLGTTWKNTSPSNFKVLNSSAQEFTEQAHYQKFATGDRGCTDSEINPFVWGVLGNWRPTKNWAYNVNRDYGPGNLKEDGYFNLIPFWKWDNPSSEWQVTGALDNWETVSENTLHHASGFTIENKNEIGTYVAQLSTLNNSVVKAVANNARYREIVNESFEDFNMLDDNYDNGYWTYLCSQNRVGLYEGAFDNVMPYTDATAHTGNHSLEVTPGEGYSFMNVFFQADQSSSMASVPNIPYSPQTWERLQNSSQNSVAVGEETGFVISYWRRLGTELNYDVNKRLKDQYDPVQIELNLGTNSIPNYNRKTQKSVIIDGWQKIDEIISFEMPLSGVNIALSFKNASSTKGYIDDIRIHPLHSNMLSHVYNMYTSRKVAELDANNYATFYEYNEEGSVIRVKKETERGVVTIQETRDFIVRN